MQILELLEQHNHWRRDCLNLIASENSMSPYCEKYYISDLMHRYAEGLPYKRYYQGLKYIDQIEDLTQQLFKDHYQANFVDLRPISGTLANMAVFSALAQKGDNIMSLGIQGGSHVSHEQAGAVGILGLNSYPLAINTQNATFNLTQIKKDLLRYKPKFIVLGGSVILFPQPIKELKNLCQLTNTKIIYDAAHVLGLITANLFQNPLLEGADIITASTHKTFPGPQGGLILGNIPIDLQKQIQKKVFPGVLSNHHLHRLPALYLTLKEMQQFGTAYMTQTINNAQTLAKHLDHLSLQVLYKERGFTQSHQVVLNVQDHGGGDQIANKLEQANIIVNKNIIPLDIDNPHKPSGLRLGVQEMTRYGMKEQEMKHIAELIHKTIITPTSLTQIKEEVIQLRARFQKIQYCLE